MPDTPPSVPNFTQWPSFPFEGDLRVKQLDDPVATEPPRRGEGDRECTACGAPDEAYIWVSERWRVRAMDRPTGLPMVLILESRSHLDLGDLPNLLAAELGVLTVRLERAIRSLDGVSRVHVNRWGDGSAHLHLWFLARPYGQLQLRGTFLPLWDSILPPIPESTWRENLALVAAWLADFGGRQLAEPPRIQWQAPASFGAVETAEYSETETETDTVEAAKETESVQAALGEGYSDSVARQQSATDGGGTAGSGGTVQGGDTAGTAQGGDTAGTAESVGGAGADAVLGGEPGNAAISADADVPADDAGAPEAAAASARAATIPQPQGGGDGAPGRAEGEGVPGRAESTAAPDGAARGRTGSGVLEQAGDTPPPRPTASNAVPS